MYSFVSKITQIKLKYILDNTKVMFFPISLEYTLLGNEYFVQTMISHSRNTSVSLEGRIYIIKKENKPLEGSQTVQKNDPSKRLCSER